ncbi:hypothetical protein ABZ839_32255 [Streptomyces cellulosae]
MLGKQFPKVRAMLLEAKDEPAAFAVFQERLYREVKRLHRCCLGLPNDNALLL